MLRRDARVVTSDVGAEKFGRDIRWRRFVELLLIKNYFLGLGIYNLSERVDGV